MKRTLLFLLACVLPGVGGAGGSMLGNAFGRSGLWIGGVLGGLLAAALVARIAAWRHWIEPAQVGRTTLGTAIGFLLATAVAVNTLSSPIGPILSTLLTGTGALVGSRRSTPLPR